MATAQIPSYAFHRQYSDFDALTEEARHWHLDLRQLDRGRFQGHLLQFGIGNVHIGEARFGRKLVQKGAPPVGLRTIAIPAKRNLRFSWRGQQVTGEDLAIFPRGADLSSISSEDFHVYTCSFPEQLLGILADSYQLEALDGMLGNASVVRCQAEAIRSVRVCLRELCGFVRTSDNAPASSEFTHLTTHELPVRLLRAIATSRATCSPRTTRKREIALLQAEAFIEQFGHEGITVRDICRHVHVSQRTLEYAFGERFGLTPKAYLMAYRLNAVRRELRAADINQDHVADIANRWGFWHLGQFAVDYRKRFDESPSETLRRIDSVRSS